VTVLAWPDKEVASVTLEKTRVNSRPFMTFDSDSHEGIWSVTFRNLDPELLAAIRTDSLEGGRLESSFRVAVLGAKCAEDESLPDMLGRYELLEDGVRFVPGFPFEPGLRYRAAFDSSFGSSSNSRSEPPDVVTLEFALPLDQTALPAKVDHVFPYVSFSGSMSRGRVEDEIKIVDQDGQRVTDLLYRPPVELWDRNMRHLSILLDPGRIKRGLGPNLALGPPLKAGREYTLSIGSGMTDNSGRPLREGFSKRFRVTEAVRERIAPENWEILSPTADSRQPLELAFPRPLDWALLLHAIEIVSEDARTVVGKVSVDRCETRWKFTPISPWRAGGYQIRVAPDIEDVCGNTVMAAFDKAIDRCGDAASGWVPRSITFEVAKLRKQTLQ
jgi:hypothetical protein